MVFFSEMSSLSSAAFASKSAFLAIGLILSVVQTITIRYLPTLILFTNYNNLRAFCTVLYWVTYEKILHRTRSQSITCKSIEGKWRTFVQPERWRPTDRAFFTRKP